MSLIHLTKQEYCISQWSGGTTTQVAIAPENALYADRTFLWRISSATVDLEESDFTSLPDYHRWISTLHGDMKLSHENGAPILLTPYQVHAFDGGVNTHSWGKCTDFNLMLRKGACDGSIRSISLDADKTTTIRFTHPLAPTYTQADLLIFCGEGTATISLGDESVTLSTGESVLLHHASNSEVGVAATVSTKLMVAEMQY